MNNYHSYDRGFLSLIAVVLLSSSMLISTYLTHYYINNLLYAENRFETFTRNNIDFENCEQYNELYSSFDSFYDLMNC